MVLRLTRAVRTWWRFCGDECGCPKDTEGAPERERERERALLETTVIRKYQTVAMNEERVKSTGGNLDPRRRRSWWW